jgi:hypothetical protein
MQQPVEATPHVEVVSLLVCEIRLYQELMVEVV